MFGLLSRLSALLFLTCFLTACTSAYVPPPPEPLSFTGMPIKLDIASIAIDDRTHAGTQQKPTLVELAHRWADQRLVAVGSQGIATLTITDASVVEQKLALRGGLTGTFGDQQDSRLSANLRATLTVAGPGPRPGDFATYSAKAMASGEATTLESSTAGEREAIYVKLVQSVASSFDDAMQTEIRRSMAPVIQP